jgi:RND family efflux transporter MFP subunit
MNRPRIKPEFLRHLALVLVMAAMAVVAVLWLSGAFHRGKIRPGRVMVPSTLPDAQCLASGWVERVRRPRDAEVVGSIQSERRTSISARVMANVVEMRVAAGDAVHRGQVLVVLEDAAPRARIEQAKQTFHAAQASQTLADSEVRRMSPLLKSGATSQSQFDEWQSRLASANADVLRAQQEIREAEVALSDTQIVSPMDGLVIDRQVEAGEQATPGQPLLTLYDPNRLRMEASVGESYTGKLRIGQKTSVLVESLSEQRPGVVEEIVPAADPASRAFLVKIRIEDPHGLYPGMYARTRVPLGTEERIEVPTSAVRDVGQLALVEIIENGRTFRRSVRLGRQDGDQIEVLSGLEPGERVVLARP